MADQVPQLQVPPRSPPTSGPPRQTSGQRPSPRKETRFDTLGSSASVSLMTKQQQGSKIQPPKLVKEPREDGDEEENEEDHWLHMSIKAIVLVCVVFGSPYICRNSGLSAASRCIVLIVSVLFLNLAEVMPLFC